MEGNTTIVGELIDFLKDCDKGAIVLRSNVLASDVANTKPVVTFVYKTKDEVVLY